MNAHNLNQSGKVISDKPLEKGDKVYFYRPPSQQEVIKRGRKAKHLMHYQGPAIIIGSIEGRKRQYQISRQQNSESKKYFNTQVEVKLDTCGSVSIGHSSFLTDIKACKDYKVPTVVLKGIGGKTEPLTKVGILKHVLPNKRTVKWLCYVIDTPVGHSHKLLLLGMSAIKLSKIDINFHIDR